MLRQRIARAAATAVALAGLLGGVVAFGGSSADARYFDSLRWPKCIEVWYVSYSLTGDEWMFLNGEYLYAPMREAQEVHRYECWRNTR